MLQPFIESLAQCPKHGLHNPFKSPERYDLLGNLRNCVISFQYTKAFGHALYRYLLYGDISTKAAHMLALPKVSDFFTRLIQRVAPKSYQQAAGEVFVTRKFLENFCGDQVRELFLCWFLVVTFKNYMHSLMWLNPMKLQL